MRCPTYIRFLIRCRGVHALPWQERRVSGLLLNQRSVIHFFFSPANLSQCRLKPTNLFIRQKHFLCVRFEARRNDTKTDTWHRLFPVKSSPVSSCTYLFFFLVPEDLQPRPPLSQLFHFVSSERAAGTRRYSLPNSLGLGGEKVNRNTLSRLFMWMKNGNPAVYFSFCAEYARRPMFVLDEGACALFPRWHQRATMKPHPD